uniref:Uncharacterized protein n=1 Tax=Panagrolaimus superbus TaxID=310955 RepID=A0A914ZFY7_9BILA
MSDRIQINLQRTIKEVQKIQEEYNDLLIHNPPPWSSLIKIKMETKIQRIKQSHAFILQALDKWEEVAKKTKDPDEKQLQYQSYDEWRDNDDNSKLLNDLTEIVMEGGKYLQLETEDDNSSIISNSTDFTPKNEIIATMPPLNLPKFNGDYLKWNTFWQRFEHAVHNRPFPKIEKLITLMGLLEGRASEEIEGFQVSEENYETIVDILINRFGKKQLIIMQLQSQLRAVEAAKPNPESLRSTVNIICNMCRQLENLGVDINNDSVKMDIIEKLPNREKDELKWFLISSPETATIEQIMKRMKDMALKAELSSKNQKEVFVETKTSSFQPPNNDPSSFSLRSNTDKN